KSRQCLAPQLQEPTGLTSNPLHFIEAVIGTCRVAEAHCSCGSSREAKNPVIVQV
ncbi:hypothetical protein LEMLEM_LOCUS3944, partial [Lemmus lemmus]